MSGKQCTACSVVADLAPHCLHRYVCPNTKDKYGSASTLLSVPIFRINTVPGFQEAIKDRLTGLYAHRHAKCRATDKRRIYKTSVVIIFAQNIFCRYSKKLPQRDARKICFGAETTT